MVATPCSTRLSNGLRWFASPTRMDSAVMKVGGECMQRAYETPAEDSDLRKKFGIIFY